MDVIHNRGYCSLKSSDEISWTVRKPSTFFIKVFLSQTSFQRPSDSSLTQASVAAKRLFIFKYPIRLGLLHLLSTPPVTMSQTTTTTTATTNSNNTSASTTSKILLTASETPTQPTNKQQEDHHDDDEDEDIYDEIEIEDMTFHPSTQLYTYPCPCGEEFEITLQSLRTGETDIAVCPSCSLRIRVVYDVGDLPEEVQEDVKDGG